MVKLIHACAAVVFALVIDSAFSAPPDWRASSGDAAIAQLRAMRPVWHEPGHNAAGSMPIGNGALGANVWIEDNGDAVLLLSHTDSFSEAERLLKLGRVRIRCTPALPIDASFTQLLQIEDGCLRVLAGDGRLRIFVDAASPTIFVALESDSPRTVSVTLEPWRNEERMLTGDELKSSWLMHDAPASIEVKESADVLVDDDDAIVWYHRNAWSYAPMTLERQGLASVASCVDDPLILRTFGGRIEGDGFVRADSKTLVSQVPATRVSVQITTSCSQADDLDGWLERLAERAASVPSESIACERTAQWWNARWRDSFILVEPGEAPSVLDSTPTIAEAYALQRFVTLAATRGAFPMKFNGSIFTIAPAPINGKPFNDDWRAWGGAYWWQNTRLPYHGMLARGDADTMQSLFAFYSRLLPIASARARLYYDADGAYFPETMTTFGTYANADYGWNREGKNAGDIDCAWWRWAWNQGPELVALMLDHWDYTHDRAQLDAQTLPIARAMLAYFDSRFKLDANGVMVITPTQSLETYWHGVVNDLPTVAGLREITERLCALPMDVGSKDDRALWERVRASCPALPTSVNAKNGVTTFAAAERFDPQRSNCENPELVAVWPFNLAGVGRGNLELGRASYAARIEHFVNGWPQDGQQAARLGLADEAASIVLAKSRNTNKAFRFPTFWGPNFDWVPDQCHGGNLMTTLQEMLLQSVGDKIIVCPAVPKSWSGKFRLHAAHNTTVTASLTDGCVEWITVDPSSRAKDVEFGEGWSLR